MNLVGGDHHSSCGRMMRIQPKAFVERTVNYIGFTGESEHLRDTMQNKVPNFASLLSRKFSLEYSAELFELEIEGTQ